MSRAKPASAEVSPGWLSRVSTRPAVSPSTSAAIKQITRPGHERGSRLLLLATEFLLNLLFGQRLVADRRHTATTGGVGLLGGVLSQGIDEVCDAAVVRVVELELISPSLQG